MRFWTIQPRGIWRRMERGEAVRVDPDHPRYGGKRPWQYEWLGSALQSHRPGFDGGWPWWLRCDAPDLDRLRGSRQPGGVHQVCIELELPPERSVSFPLWMWETIHTGNYLAASREELDGWLAELRSAAVEPEQHPLPAPWQERLEASWYRLFDPAFRPRFWYRDEPVPGDDSVLHDLMRRASEGNAGWTGELRATDTVRATTFEAAG